MHQLLSTVIDFEQVLSQGPAQKKRRYFFLTTCLIGPTIYNRLAIFSYGLKGI